MAGDMPAALRSTLSKNSLELAGRVVATRITPKFGSWRMPCGAWGNCPGSISLVVTTTRRSASKVITTGRAIRAARRLCP
jgi:hypothetical protein